ncbi:MAG: alkaline phosphatase family protein [Phycisphaerales bacterium]|nr:MAG: alkaline phosphatase family protein [Phycisphaerales bacterium]
MRSAAVFTVAALASFSLTLSATGQLPNDTALRPKVLFIGLDGIRSDAMHAASTPNLNRLRNEGAWSDHALTDVITVSGPCWSAILTGVWSTRHGVIDNTFENDRYAEFPHFFARLKEKRPDLITASFIDWLPLDEAIVTDAACNLRFTHDYEDDGDVRMVEQAENLLRTGDPDLTFFYFADPDTAGHEYGFHPAAPGYLREIEQVDQQLGRLLAAVRARPEYENERWLILVTSDHGGTLDGSHGRDEPKHRYVPFIMHAPGIVHREILPAPATVDASVTALAHLGVEIDPAWKLDGRVIPSRPRADMGVNLIVNGDAEHAPGTADPQVNLVAPGWDDMSPITVLEYGCAEGYPDGECPGPADCGRCFFGTGASADCAMSQTIGLDALAEPINRGTIAFELSGYLGGFADQRDFATLTAIFLDERGGELARSSIGPVTLDDRREALDGEVNDLTGLLRRSVKRPVPPGAHCVRIILELEVGSGACDGYADNLSFTLSQITR